MEELFENPQAIILLVFMVIAALKFVGENLKGKKKEDKTQPLAELYDESRQQILQRQRGEVGAAADEEGASGAVANLAPVQRLSGSVNAMVALSGLGQETRWSLEAGQRIHDGLDARLRSAS